MAEAGITTEIGKVLRRVLPQKRLEVKEVPRIDRAQAFDNVIERLLESHERAKTLGRYLEYEQDYLSHVYQREKAKNPDLTVEAFLQAEHKRSEGESRLVPSHGWRIEDLDRNVARKPGERPGVDIRGIAAILGEEPVGWDETWIEKRFGRYEDKWRNHDDGFRFALERDEGHANFQGRFAFFKNEGEREAGLKLWVKVEVGGPMGDFFMHKGAVRGDALEIPWETEVDWLRKATSQTVSQK